MSYTLYKKFHKRRNTLSRMYKYFSSFYSYFGTSNKEICKNIINLISDTYLQDKLNVYGENNIVGYKGV